MLRIEVSYRGLLLAGLAILSLVVLVKLWPVILLVVTALILVAALLPYVDWLVRHRIPRTAAVLLLLAAFVAVVAGLFALMVPAVVNEFQNIRDHLPDDARKLQDFLSNFGVNVELEQRARDIDWSKLVSGSAAVDYGQRILLTALSIITIVALTVYMLVDMPRLSRFLFQFVPPGREPEVEKIMSSVNRVVGGYVRAQVITSVIITIYTFVVLLALRAPNPVAFAVLAGFADIIPILGPFLSVLPASVATLDQSTTRAVIVLVLLTLYQQFEDRILVPRVYGQNLNLPPLIVLIAVLAGGELLGVAGVLLALPAAAVGRVALEYVMDMRKAQVAPPGPPGEPLAPDTDNHKPDSEPEEESVGGTARSR